ncbi:MAG: hypothetical protein AAFZ04_10955, partial [Pseudomonadota bacterium]
RRGAQVGGFKSRQKGGIRQGRGFRGQKCFGISATPYAYALDLTGEKTLGLIEADPFATSAPEPVMNDADWLRLQAICGS